jgi:hypothetical protein
MHLFSLGFYLALICGLEFSMRLDTGRSLAAWWRLTVRLTLAILTCSIVPVLLYLRSPVFPENTLGMEVMWNNTPAKQMMNLFSAIWTYASIVDVLFLLPIVLICTNATRTRRFELHTGLAITAVGLVIIACLSPRSMLGTGWISWRFPIMALLSAMVMFCPLPNLARRQAILLAMALTIAVFGRTAWIGYNWWQGARDAADVEEVLDAASPGSAILPLGHMVRADPFGKWQRHFAWGEDTYRHLPTLAIPIAHAFVPTVFTARGKQPLVVIPPWNTLAVPEGSLHSTAVLSCSAWLNTGMLTAPFLRDWRHRFDYVLVVDASEPDQYVGDALPGGLQLIRESSFARLYKIDKQFVDEKTASAIKCPPTLPGVQ